MSVYECCPFCAELHDVLALEPSFLRPDPFLDVPMAQREERTWATKDACVVRGETDDDIRYFLRCLVPFSLEFRDEAVSWGVWVEVGEQSFSRTMDLWHSPEQADEPPFLGKLANELPGYSNSLEITGMVSLTDSSTVPTFHLISPRDHPFVIEQHSIITSERLAEWLAPIYHPDWSIPESSGKASTQQMRASTEEVQKKPWWQFW